MLRLIRRLALSVAVLAALLAVLAYLALDAKPEVQAPAGLSRQEIDRVERLLRESDPRGLRGPVYRTLVLTTDDLNALLGYLSERLQGATSRVSLAPGEAHTQVTLRVPPNPLGGYLNVAATLAARRNTLVARDLRIGRVPVPEFLTAWGWRWVEGLLDQDPTFRLAREAVRDLRIGRDAVRVRYEWRPELAGAARDRLVPQADQDRLARYQERLGEVLARPQAARDQSVLALLQALAAASPAESDGLAAENRALLVVLAAYALGRDLRLLSPQAAARAPRRAGSITLRGRVDLAQHFLTSAALSAAGGEGLADAMGLSKELADARGGSGFSFTDLAADRAGARFGTTATDPSGGGRAWRERLAAGIGEADVMPAVADLPELLPEKELLARFGGVGTPRYDALLEEIDRRVAALAFYR